MKFRNIYFYKFNIVLLLYHFIIACLLRQVNSIQNIYILILTEIFVKVLIIKKLSLTDYIYIHVLFQSL